MARPVHFEIHATDVDRGRRFYETVFGWKIEQWGDQPYWIITTGEEGEPGINGGLLPRNGPEPEIGGPVSAHVLTVQVDDLDDTLAKALAARATVAMEKTEMAGVGWLAYLFDTEGNLFGLMQPEPAG